MFVCALPLVSESENAKEVLCALRWPLLVRARTQQRLGL